MQIDEKADAWLEDERTSTLYQVIGSLAEAAGVFDDPHVIRALDLAAYGKTQDGGDVLPFCPAYESAKQKGEAEGWRDIESAPKDGTNILLAHALAVFDGYWDVYANGWVDDVTDLYEDKITYQPTHWRPLPEPPTMLSAGGEG
jgi:hypothetical protein